MTTYSQGAMRAELGRDEGVRLKPYVDTVGKVSIGIGRNLTDVGITSQITELMYQEDVARAEHDLDTYAAWWRGMTDARQRGLLNMCFNMGWGDGSHGLSSFKHSLALLQAGKYEEAAVNVLKSKWAQQVGARGDRISEQFRVG